MSIIIRTRDGKEFTTHHLWEELLTGMQTDVYGGNEYGPGN